SDEFGGRTSVRFEDQGYLLVGGEAPAESWVTDLLSRCRGQDLPGLHFEVSIVRLPGAAAKELKLLEHPRLQQTPPQAAVLMQRLLKADKARLINLPPIATAPMVALRIDHPGKVQKDKPTVESPLHLLCMAFPCADGAMAVDVRLEASSLLVNAAGQLPPGQVLMQAQALGDVVWILQVRSREEPPKKQRHARSRGPRLRRRR
ncbi:MAG TPA: hypothetical protein VK348_12745, partial [Planctomycetota bacterium]|nr:hypothetical protein [Planctomycetota bacterium]